MNSMNPLPTTAHTTRRYKALVTKKKVPTPHNCCSKPPAKPVVKEVKEIPSEKVSPQLHKKPITPQNTPLPRVHVIPIQDYESSQNPEVSLSMEKLEDSMQVDVLGNLSFVDDKVLAEEDNQHNKTQESHTSQSIQGSQGSQREEDESEVCTPEEQEPENLFSPKPSGNEDENIFEEESEEREGSSEDPDAVDSQEESFVVEESEVNDDDSNEEMEEQENEEEKENDQEKEKLKESENVKNEEKKDEDQNTKENIKIKEVPPVKKASHALPKPVQKYTLFEDWKMLQVAEYWNKINAKGILSISFWENCKDIDTGERLLHGKRSGESLRERYRKWIRYLRPKDQETIRRFAEAHTDQEMKGYSCVFEKFDDKHLFVKIQKNPGQKMNINMQTPNRENLFHIKREYTGPEQLLTPYFWDVKRQGEHSLSQKEDSNPVDRYLSVSDFDRVPLMRCGDGLSHSELLREIGHDMTSISWDRIEDSRGSQSQSQSQNRISKGVRSLDNEVLLKRTVPDEFTLGSYGDRGLWGNVKRVKRNPENSIRSVPAFEESERSRSMYDIICADEGSKGSIRSIRRSEESLGKDMDSMMRLIRGSEGSEREASRRSGGSNSQKEKQEIDTSLVILVDKESMTRRFVKRAKVGQEPLVEETRIGRIARKYGLQGKLDKILELLHAVSGDFEDLEEYLQGNDENMLWTKEDDEGLLENHETVMRYLRKLKGEERIEKRKKFLLGQRAERNKLFI